MSAWPTVALKDCVRVVGGATPKSGSADFWDGDVPWTTPKDLSDLNGKFLSDTPRKITELGLKSCAAELLPANSVLFSSRAPIGHVAINSVPMATNQGFKSMVPGPKVDASFLYWWLKCHRAEIELLGNGATFKEVSKTVVERIEVPLPPLDEQKRIAAILDHADELRRKRQRAIDRLNQLGQAIFHDMFGDPATNPKGFEALPLGDAVEFIGGSQPAKSHFLYEDGPDRVRFVQIRDFRTDKYPTWVPKALAKRPFTEDDVMIGRYGPPVFQIFRGLSGTYNVALMKAKPKLHLTSDFVFYLLQEPKLHSFVVANSERTAGQSGVNLDLLEKYPAYAPPAALLREYSDRIADVDGQARAYREASMAAERLFASLQHRAFQGEL